MILLGAIQKQEIQSWKSNRENKNGEMLSENDNNEKRKWRVYGNC